MAQLLCGEENSALALCIQTTEEGSGQQGPDPGQAASRAIQGEVAIFQKWRN